MTTPNIKTLKNKLIFYTIFAIVIYLVGCIIFFAFVFPTQFNNSQKKLNNYTVAAANKDISAIFDSARNLYLRINDDSKFSESISNLYEETKLNKAYEKPRDTYQPLLNAAKNSLYSLIHYNSNYINAVAVTFDNEILVHTRQYAPDELLKKLPSFESGISFFKLDVQDNSYAKESDNYILAFPYTISENIKGHMCFFIKEPYIFSQTDSITYILDEKSCIFTNNQILGRNQEKKFYNEWRNSSQTVTQGINNKTYFVSTRKIDLYNWTLVNLLESNSFNQTVQQLIFLVIFIMIFGIILMLFLSSVLSSTISRSIVNTSHEIDIFMKQLENNVFTQKNHLRNSHLYNFTRKFTLKKKLWAYFICVVLFPILIISITIVTQSVTLINTEFEKKSNALVKNVQNSLDYTLNEYNSALSNIITNDELTLLFDDYTNTISENERVTKYMSLNDKIYNSSYLMNNATFSFFDKNGLIFTVPDSKALYNDNFYSKITKKFSVFSTWNSTKQSYNLHLVKYIYTLNRFSNNIKYSSISIPPETFIPMFSAISDDCIYFLTDENGVVFLSNTQQTPENVVNTKRSKALVIKGETDTCPIYFTVSIPKTDANSANTNLLVYVLILVAAVTLVILYFINMFNNHIINHASYVNIILNTEAKLPEYKCNDELDLLTVSVKNMKEKLHNLIDQVYKHKILETELQLKAMQSQITPHFLYNTLEIISSLIQIEDDRAVDLTLLLSDFFRQGISRGQSLLPLRMELSYTNVYLDIHRIILGNKLKVSIDISSELENNVIINFSLQPILENTLKHGAYL